MYKFFFLAFFLFMNTASFAQEFLEKRQAPKEFTQDETLPLLEQWKEEGVSFEKWDSYFQNQVDVSNYSKDWHFEDLQYRIHIDENGKVLTIDILNPSVHSLINEQAKHILHSLKNLTILPATKLGRNVAFTLEGYLLFDMCKCAYNEEEVSTNSANSQEPSKEVEVFKVVEQLPVFGNCDGKDYMQCTNKNVINYVNAELAKYSYKTEGKVYVSFVVNENGFLEAIKVKNGVNEELDKIALKIVEMMPQWKPGMSSGVPVKVSFAIPIIFVK